MEEKMLDYPVYFRNQWEYMCRTPFSFLKDFRFRYSWDQSFVFIS